MEHTLSIFGLGKLGASMMAGMASRGISVIGVDKQKDVVECVNSGRSPIKETDVESLIASNRIRIRATRSAREAVINSSLSFIVVPTPSDERGAFSLQFIQAALHDIGKALKEKDFYHVVVITSTVLPGSTRYGLLPVLEKASGKHCGPDFGLCYGPEFIALGSVVGDFLNPDFHLIGEFDERSGNALEMVNRQICGQKTPCRRMSLENAELAKIAINSYVTLKISFANMLADICERIPGGNVDKVTDALGMDSRIGRKYLTGGLGFGGPCFPRDNSALNFIGEAIGADCSILQANDAYNLALTARLVNRIKPMIPPESNVAVLGLAYKPMSHVVEDSPGISLVRTLVEAGYRVSGYDPLAVSAARKVLENCGRIVDSLKECLKDADFVLIVTPDPIFVKLVPTALIKRGKSVTVIDFWRLLEDSLNECPGIHYIPIGRCMDERAGAEKLQQIWVNLDIQRDTREISGNESRK